MLIARCWSCFSICFIWVVLWHHHHPLLASHFKPIHVWLYRFRSPVLLSPTRPRCLSLLWHGRGMTTDPMTSVMCHSEHWIKAVCAGDSQWWTNVIAHLITADSTWPNCQEEEKSSVCSCLTSSDGISPMICHFSGITVSTLCIIRFKWSIPSNTTERKQEKLENCMWVKVFESNYKQDNLH